MASELMNPCRSVQRVDGPLVARRPVTANTVVGLFTNQKANTELFHDNNETLLARRYLGIEFIRYAKFGPDQIAKITAGDRQAL